MVGQILKRALARGGELREEAEHGDHRVRRCKRGSAARLFSS
jgi:hypothetical protein